jgi:hypothetical protein
MDKLLTKIGEEVEIRRLDFLTWLAVDGEPILLSAL